MQEPPQETWPSGVKTREGFIFGQFSLWRGSTGKQRGSAAKKPTDTAMRLLVKRMLIKSLRSRPLFLATKSRLSGRYDAYGRWVSMYRLMALASLGLSNRMGSLKIRLGTFVWLRSPSWVSRSMR